MMLFQVENDYNTPVSLKRSLSDPEIYFPSAVRHSLIVAVNGILPHDRPLPPAGASARSLSDDRSSPGEGGGGGGGARGRTLIQAPRHRGGETGNSLQIDINVIQPTPNISPSHSLRSFSTEDREAADSIATFAGIPFLVVPPSPVRTRRVSFSDHSLSSEENISMLVPTNPDISISAAAGEGEGSAPGSAAVQRRRCVRQASLQVTDLTSPSAGTYQVLTLSNTQLGCDRNLFKSQSKVITTSTGNFDQLEITYLAVYTLFF